MLNSSSDGSMTLHKSRADYFKVKSWIQITWSFPLVQYIRNNLINLSAHRRHFVYTAFAVGQIRSLLKSSMSTHASTATWCKIYVAFVTIPDNRDRGSCSLRKKLTIFIFHCQCKLTKIIIITIIHGSSLETEANVRKVTLIIAGYQGYHAFDKAFEICDI